MAVSGKVSRYGIIDKETGEVIEEEVLFFGKPNKHVDKGFIKIFVSFLDSLMTDKEIVGKAIRLLLYMINKMDYESLRVIMYPEDAMRDLKISRITYYRWLEILEKKECIKRIRNHTYEIKPYSFVKGNMEKTEKKMRVVT